MADVNQRDDVREDKVQEPAKTKSELVARNAKVEVTPFGVPQSTFSEQMAQGFPGMVNRMVDYNAVTRSAEGGNIPACRAVSQSVAADIGAVLGGSANGFLGITIYDPTIITPVGSGLADGVYPQYTNMGVITKGEIFATATTAVAAGDPVFFVAATGILTNVGTDVAAAGCKWKYTRTANQLNAITLGVQR
jgi:hypothetical protein